ncbi:MAG: hypothetical protein Q4C66_06275 [Lachnospiraceae bacterium]|nr:hypothetical protein [Lachnospiraceae bacterium]
MKKKVLQGLNQEEYIHDEELAIMLGTSDDIIHKGLDKINDISVALMRRMTLGRYIAVDESSAPELSEIVTSVCRILDYPEVPKIYICHQAAQTIFCAGTDTMIIVISDYIIENFDMDMLYYTIGNTISMFKSGHVSMVTAYAIMPEMLLTAPVELGIKKYLRAADMTSDRGGLLACQNISAALKCILWEAGIPLTEIRYLDEKETIQLARSYIKSVENISLDCVTGLAAHLKEYNMDFMPHPYRINELLKWYETGYQELIKKRGG